MEIKIGETLAKIVKSKRLTIKEISVNSGVPATTISEWLNNRTPKNPIQVRKVADYLGVTFHYLIFGEDDRQEPISKILKEDFFSGTFEITVKRIKF